MFNVTLETQRLFLRPLAPQFAPAFFQGIDTYRDTLITYFPKTCATNISLLATEAYMVNKQQERKRKVCFANAIFLKTETSEVLIGMIMARELDWRVPKAELSYFILPPYQQNGYAKEALTCFTDWCFSSLGIGRLYMEIGGKNAPSQHLATSCGFELEGQLRKHYLNGKGELEDVLVFGKLSSLEKN